MRPARTDTFRSHHFRLLTKRAYLFNEADLKRKGVTHSRLVEKLVAIGVDEKEVNVRNKLLREVHGSVFITMSDSHRRDRGAFIVLGMALAAIVLVTWLSQSPNNQVDQDASAQIEQPENSDISQPVTSMREYDPWADSYAQWMMAVLSVIATGVSVWAVLLLRDTLVETRRAIRAADDAVEVTREIGVIQMRPWLSFIQWTLEPIGQKGDVSSYIIVFKWRNTGSTPAISVRAVTNRSNAPEFVDEGSLFDYVRIHLESSPLAFFSTPALIFPLRDCLPAGQSRVRCDALSGTILSSWV